MIYETMDTIGRASVNILMEINYVTGFSRQRIIQLIFHGPEKTITMDFTGSFNRNVFLSETSGRRLRLT